LFQLSPGQLLAARGFGLAPFWWGWIVAAIAIAVVLFAAYGRLPDALHLRRDPLEEPDAATTSKWMEWVTLGALALHAAGLRGQFSIFDDTRQIHFDKLVTNPSWAHLLEAIQNYKGTNQELMYVSFQASYKLAKLEYWPWYLQNLAVLVPIVWLLHGIGWRLSKSRWVSLLLPAFFVAHPLMSEILCWISARSHLYGLVFALLSAWAYLEARARTDKRGRWFALSLFAFVMSQFGKPVFVFLPAWLLLFDLWEGRRDWRWVALNKVPYLLVGVGFVYKIAKAGAGQRLIKPKPLGGDYFHTLLTDFNLMVEYGRSLFVPVIGAPLPPFNAAVSWYQVEATPQVLANGFAPLASLIILLAVGALCVVLWVRYQWRTPAFWLAMVLVSMVTVLNFPNRGHAATFEYRYTLSAHVATAWLIADALVRLARTRLSERPMIGRAPVVVATAYLVVCMIGTAANTEAWRTNVNLWVRQATWYPQTYYAQYYAAKAWQHANSNYSALQYLHAAEKYHEDTKVRLGVDDLMLWRRIGDNAYYVKDFDKAREYWPKYFLRKPADINETYVKRFEEVGLEMNADKTRLLPPPPPPRLRIEGPLAPEPERDAAEGEASKDAGSTSDAPAPQRGKVPLRRPAGEVRRLLPPVK